MAIKLIPAVLIAATMLVASTAHAAEVEGYEMVVCATMPYPYDESCSTKASPVRADREACENDAARFNNRQSPNSRMSARCEAFTVDCSQTPRDFTASFICATARNRAQ
jgi:hypothetical protein